ncbi:hypothetical protein L596_009904 [Steinernema carpocapsae]|uniref:Uncharacterized protein n=1 Tax=Steinernema carpocapsae TaxID=34508 RepID=A0A4U5PH05_STECR|nr:hypothetical protein L596_009904 [Steinernema carpocapsae]
MTADYSTIIFTIDRSTIWQLWLALLVLAFLIVLAISPCVFSSIYLVHRAVLKYRKSRHFQRIAMEELEAHVSVPNLILTRQ